MERPHPLPLGLPQSPHRMDHASRIALDTLTLALSFRFIAGRTTSWGIFFRDESPALLVGWPGWRSPEPEIDDASMGALRCALAMIAQVPPNDPTLITGLATQKVPARASFSWVHPATGAHSAHKIVQHLATWSPLIDAAITAARQEAGTFPKDSPCPNSSMLPSPCWTATVTRGRNGACARPPSPSITNPAAP